MRHHEREHLANTMWDAPITTDPFATTALVFIIAATISISFIDSLWMVIPDAMNLCLGAGGLLAARHLPPITVSESVTGLVIGGATAWLFRLLYRKARGREGIGLGDVKFLAAAGTWVGAEGLAPLLLAASTTGLLLVGGRLLAGHKLRPTDRLPFAPFLCIGLLCVVIPQILSGSLIHELLLRALP
ncbi:prepilin peptidase [Bradyrhizobium brasilense]|uniref:A24 family peptidase n=1 Tax=Bradyrhizobium brasilense TaxID=1419277 RepID=A0ABY8JSJ8_9BRAD|nr:A24 family peptidase [Bradyrhizobium brasilense]WFU66687.1 A24 family peptidase [Bradyrhizobium brasilense]